MSAEPERICLCPVESKSPSSVRVICVQFDVTSAESPARVAHALMSVLSVGVVVEFSTSITMFAWSGCDSATVVFEMRVVSCVISGVAEIASREREPVVKAMITTPEPPSPPAPPLPPPLPPPPVLTVPFEPPAPPPPLPPLPAEL